MKHILRAGLLMAILGSTALQAQQLNPVTNEFLVNQQVSGTQTYPHVASDENGGYVIVWRHTANTLMARRYGPDHQPLTDEIVVAQGNLARVYYWSEGRYVIAWSGTPAAMKVLNADNTLSETYPVGYGDGVDMDIRGDELVHVATGSQHIHIRKWDLLTHAWTGPSVQVSEAPNANYRYPQVRWTNTGQIVTVYSRGSGTNRIYRKTFNSNLLAQIPEEIVHTLNFGLVSVINVSINALDQLLIYAKFGVNGTDVFWGRVLGPDGTELTAGVGNMSAPYAYYYTDCELFDNGNVVLTNNHMNSLNDPEDYNVRVNYGINFGSPNTGWQPASNTVSGEQRYPHVTKLPNGGFLMVWNGNGFQGDTDGVYARAFGAAGWPGITSNTTLPVVVDETGTTQQLGLRLGTPPTGNVVIDLAVSDPTEAAIGTAQLTFTPANWDQVQQVTITGVDDTEDDGDIDLHVTASMNAATADATYAALPATQYAVVNRDDDATFLMPADQSFCRTVGMAQVALTITNNGDPVGAPVAVSSDQSVVPDAALSIVQADATTYHVAIASLEAQAAGTATITVTVTDGSFTYSDAFDVTTLGTVPVITWADPELVSTPAVSYQWYLNGAAIAGATGQTWTPLENGNYTVETSDAGGCVMLSTAYLFTGANWPGLTSNTPLPVVVDETGTTQQLGLRLGTPPTGNVVIDLAVSDPTEADVGTAQLTFTPANWDQVQQVTITGVDDAEDDGDIDLHVTATMNAATADATYAALPATQYAVVNRDDDATFLMPADQSFCRTVGMAQVALTITNNGDPVGAPVAVSSDQSVVPDAALSIVQADATTYHVAIASLEDQASGTATITVTVTDGSFTYSDAFAVTTLGTVPQIEWVDMELVCTPAVSYQWHLDGAAIAGATEQTWTPQENGLYTVETVDADGCVMLSADHFFGSTGVGVAADRAGLRVYPVPVRGPLTVEGTTAGAHITVIDAQGRTVAGATAQGERTLLDLGGLAPGSYVLRIAGHGHDQRMPVVVE